MKYVIIALTFFACNSNSHSDQQFKISTDIIDTITAAPGNLVTAPHIFETAFIKGTKYVVKDNDLDLYGVNIGKIKIVSGRIIACDPLHIDEYGKPFTQLFPTGEFPVQLSIVKHEDQETIALARIKFSDQPVVKWEFALLKGQAPPPFGSEDIEGYSVDAGIVVFMDEVAAKALNADSLTRMDAELYKEMDKHQHHSWRYALYNFGGHNLAALTTGFGDGQYATYIGFDASGQPCRLLSDFGFFDWRKK